jgi:hypothetical protein
MRASSLDIWASLRMPIPAAISRLLAYGWVAKMKKGLCPPWGEP